MNAGRTKKGSGLLVVCETHAATHSCSASQPTVTPDYGERKLCANRRHHAQSFNHPRRGGRAAWADPETKHPRSFRPNEREVETLLVFLDGLDKMS